MTLEQEMQVSCSSKDDFLIGEEFRKLILEQGSGEGGGKGKPCRRE